MSLFPEFTSIYTYSINFSVYLNGGYKVETLPLFINSHFHYQEKTNCFTFVLLNKSFEQLGHNIKFRKVDKIKLFQLIR